MKYKTLSEQISTTRAGFKLHRENFAEFKEGVLGRMKTTAADEEESPKLKRMKTTTTTGADDKEADDEEAQKLKRMQSRDETTAAVSVMII